MNSIARRLKHEMLEFIPPAIFFFVAFQLLAFTQRMMLKEYGIRTSVFLQATIGALVVAKVVLILDLLPLVNRFPRKAARLWSPWSTGHNHLALARP